MTVRELLEMLEEFDEEMEIVIGMQQKYGSDFAMEIFNDVEEHKVRAFYGKDFKAVVITEGEQLGVVDYDDKYKEEDEE